ncbi:MAG: hypothetical protein MN733_33170 [Nitrososphaera sp.]|nr:hypothetical protein [Nitrososphaera sp.]
MKPAIRQARVKTLDRDVQKWLDLVHIAGGAKDASSALIKANSFLRKMDLQRRAARIYL